MIAMSIVIPVYNSEKTLAILIEKIAGLFGTGGDMEVVLVNDASQDRSFQVCQQLARQYPWVKVLDLAGNYGQHRAIMAGLHYCSGDTVVLMDDDLQNPPEAIRDLSAKLEDGYDLVFGARKNYRQNPIRRLGSRLHQWVIHRINPQANPVQMSNFLIMRREIVREMIKYDGPDPYIQGLLLKIMPKMTHVLVEHHPRAHGKSNYHLWKLTKLAIKAWHILTESSSSGWTRNPSDQTPQFVVRRTLNIPK